jgi:thioredoxin-related protein
MVMVEGEHCRWCKKMKGRTLTDDAVEKRLENFVVVKVMREDSNAMAKLPPIEGVPTIFFMESDKAIIEKVVGYFNVEDFISYINDVEKKPN